MLKRHVDQVWSRLDQLYATGTTVITRGEIYNWFAIQRISKTPWRDLRERWQELLDEKGVQYTDPLIAEVDNGASFAFFFSPKPDKLSKLAE
ncbi:MAG TPA: hypothetical protein VGJ26_14595 [Pirellulales bacterium]|jgi:hypothetical protein